MGIERNEHFNNILKELHERYSLSLVGDELDLESKEVYNTTFENYLKAKGLVIFLDNNNTPKAKTLVASLMKVIKKTESFFEENHAYIIDSQSIIM